MKRIVTLVVSLACVCAAAAAAQDSTAVPYGDWQVDLVTGLNLSQSSFSENWAGGGNGSVVWTLTTDSKAECQFNPGTTCPTPSSSPTARPSGRSPTRAIPRTWCGCGRGNPTT